MNAPQVEIVLTLGIEILDRRTVAADLVDDEIAALTRINRGPGTWHRAITYREPLNTLCGRCGTRHCMCRDVTGLVDRNSRMDRT